MGATWVIYLANIIDWIMRVIGCAALVVIAFFICWWLGSAGFFLVAGICLIAAAGFAVHGWKHGWRP